MRHGACASTPDHTLRLPFPVRPRPRTTSDEEVLKPIIDITHQIREDMSSWENEDGIGQFLWLPKSMKNGSHVNNSEMKLASTHTGTHVDAPGHVFDHYFGAGFDVDTLDFDVLNGPALLVDVPRDKNLTAEVMKSLNISRGDIKLNGVDYLSVAAFDDAIPTHLVFLESREIILVEGLKLDDVEPGLYTVHCLPLRLPGAEGSPIRCILIK